MVHEITSTIDWCEDNFVYHDEVAEWWNSVSALVYVGLGFLGIYNACQMNGMVKKIDFSLNAICRLMVGVGTVWFHGRLTYTGQMYDEVWMLIMLAYGAYQLLKEEYPNIAYMFALPVIIFSYLHINEGYVHLFRSVFAINGIILHAIFYMRIKANTKSWEARRRRNVYQAAWVMACITIAGTFLWVTEELLCRKYYKAIFNPQLHAIFHCLTAYSLHGYSVIFHLLLATKGESWFAYKFGFLPYVSATPPTTETKGKPPKGILKHTGKAA